MRKKLLEKLKKHLEKERRLLISQNQQKLKDYLEQSTDENRDVADLANDEYENSVKASNNTHQFRVLLEIDRALDKIEDGTYGLCDSCGKEISAERLEAIPNASLCIQCQEKWEQHGRKESSEDAFSGFILPPLTSSADRED